MFSTFSYVAVPALLRELINIVIYPLFIVYQCSCELCFNCELPSSVHTAQEHTAPATIVLSGVKGSLRMTFYDFYNSLPDDKILDWSKLKQIADNILKCI